MDEAKWFVVHTYSGYENKVRDNIIKTTENRGFQDQILDVIVPLESYYEVKDDGKREKKRKMLPGYVLIHMVMNDDSWYIVRNTRGVTGFVGPGSKPVALTPQEIKALGIDTSFLEEKEPVIEFEGKPGDRVMITSGDWTDVEATIDSVNIKKQTIIVLTEMFGRATPVELKLTDVKVLND